LPTSRYEISKDWGWGVRATEPPPPPILPIIPKECPAILRDEFPLDARKVTAIAGINADGIAFLHEIGHLHFRP
jgi:hypothetical protein